MYWKLTDNIWWGDCDSLAEVSKEVGCVLNVASNNELLHMKQYNILCLYGKIPYFRLALKDRDTPDEKYMSSLESILKVCLLYKPVYIHCIAGMHRSPAVAALAAMMDSNEFTKEAYENLTKRTVELNPRVAETLDYNYRIGVQNWIMSKIRPPSGLRTSLEICSETA